jgi:hypothetical protein
MEETMKRSLIVLILAAAGAASPAFPAATGAPRHRPLDPRDALLAARGTATRECRGTLGPTQFTTETGVLARTFTSCPTGDRAALDEIDALLGVQNSDAGRRDDLAGHYVATWDALAARFPWQRIPSCPAWERTQAIEAPTFESVPRNVGRVGKTNFRYRVTSEECRGNPRCTVARAAACAQGFGREFLVELDHRRGTIVVDPAWWLTRYDYASDSSNPFKMPGYYHPMSYYGDLPGALYGARQRSGELCSQYVGGKHYTDRVLQLIDCGGGWLCMTYCMEAPLPAAGLAGGAVR